MSSQDSRTMPRAVVHDDTEWMEWKEWKKRKQFEEFCRWKEQKKQHYPHSRVDEECPSVAKDGDQGQEPQADEMRENISLVKESSSQDANLPKEKEVAPPNVKSNDEDSNIQVEMSPETKTLDTQGKNQSSEPQDKRETGPVLEQEDPNKEKVKYVLAGQPTGWTAMYKLVREYDEELIKDCKEHIDNLLVFAGLFSAVLTAFLIESYPLLQGGTSGGGGSSSALRQLSTGTSSLETRETPPQTPFQPSHSDIRVNVLWFASLLLSLIAASFAILVKQWLREYLAIKDHSPKARLRIRRLRYPALVTWGVFQIAAFLPLLLQLSLALFFIGLVYFAKSIHPSIKYTTLPLVSAWGACFTLFAALPLIFPRCPYRTTLLKSLYAWIHQHLGQAFAFASRSARVRCKQHMTQIRNTHFRKDALRKMHILGWWWWEHCSRLFDHIAYALDQANEAQIIQQEDHDLEVLSDADLTQPNDELLCTEIAQAARQVDLTKVSPHSALQFIHELLSNRLTFPRDEAFEYSSVITDLRDSSLSPRAQKAILDLAFDLLRQIPSPAQSIFDRDTYPHLLLALLLSTSGQSLAQPSLSHLTDYFSKQDRQDRIDLLCNRISTDSPLSSGDRRWISGPPHRAVHLLRGISLFHRDTNGQWSLSQALYHARGSGFMPLNHPQSKDVFPTFYKLRKHEPSFKLKYIGFRAMHYVVSLQFRAGKLTYLVVQDVLESLSCEMRSRMSKKCSAATGSDASNSVLTPPSQSGSLTIDFLTLDSLAVYISFQSWQPALFQLEKCWSSLLSTLLHEAVGSEHMALAVCSIPTLGILGLCRRAAIHTQSSRMQAIAGIDMQALPTWKNALQHVLQHELAQSYPVGMCALKLLSFSVYLYIFCTPRLMAIPEDEKQAWVGIFNNFTTSLQEQDVSTSRCDRPRCRHRTPKSALATICLEMIRFEEILTRIARSGRYAEDVTYKLPPNHATFRYPYGHMVDMTLIAEWRTAPLCSVFSEELIAALEKLAEASWKSDSSILTPNRSNDEVEFGDYCLAYVERVTDTVKIKATDVWSWLHGYCSCSSRRR